MPHTPNENQQIPLNVTSCNCQKCRHQWIPRTGRMPRRCPNCGSYSWFSPEQILKQIENTTQEKTA